jgi:hypothetical protein
MDLREIGMEDVKWINLRRDKKFGRNLVNTIMNHQVPYKAESFLNR